MQFLLMCCIDEKQWEALPGGQRDGIMADYGRFIEDAKRSGHYLAGGKLDRSSAAVTIRRPNGTASITDGPFAETKEQFGGYHVVECADMDEAVALANRIPTLPVGGTIEVRPMLHVI